MAAACGALVTRTRKERRAAALDRVAASDPDSRAAGAAGDDPRVLARLYGPPSIRRALEQLDAGDVNPDAPPPARAPEPFDG